MDFHLVDDKTGRLLSYKYSDVYLETRVSQTQKVGFLWKCRVQDASGDLCQNIRDPGVILTRKKCPEAPCGAPEAPWAHKQYLDSRTSRSHGKIVRPNCQVVFWHYGFFHKCSFFLFNSFYSKQS